MEKELQKIIEKMNVIIYLLVDLKLSIDKEKVSKKVIYKRFSDLGMSNDDIGKIFNKTGTEVSKQIYETKRKRRK